MMKTPNANRLHIGVFGKRNSGKSSLINAITGQQTALVSDVAGTTTDPVSKAMELYPIGPCLLIDTAGYDDTGELGTLRVEKTREVLERCDMALLVVSAEETDYSQEEEWISLFEEQKIPILCVVNKTDLAQPKKLPFDLPTVVVSAKTGEGIALCRDKITETAPRETEPDTIAGHLIRSGDSVLLVMPQDIQAPKGRLILPQVQTIRDLLDHGAVITCTTAEGYSDALQKLKEPPVLIITDSQVFAKVWEGKPKESKLTSFSVLMAQFKGDVSEFYDGAQTVAKLTESDRVLIAEACSHNPLDGDIGRIKIPNMLRKRVGEGITIDHVSGSDFPQDLSPYSLVIHCGGCMQTRRHVLSRIRRCREQGVPITNYGIFIAYCTGILDKVIW